MAKEMVAVFVDRALSIFLSFGALDRLFEVFVRARLEMIHECMKLDLELSYMCLRVHVLFTRFFGYDVYAFNDS